MATDTELLARKQAELMQAIKQLKADKGTLQPLLNRHGGITRTAIGDAYDMVHIELVKTEISLDRLELDIMGSELRSRQGVLAKRLELLKDIENN